MSILAPPGYGKTTLLAQWAARRSPRVAWVSCDLLSDDPVALWTAVLRSLEGIGPVGPAAARVLATAGAGIDAVPALVSAFDSVPGPVLVMLDHLEALISPESRSTIAEFALRLPAGWQLALASRGEIPVPISRLRSRGQLFEIGAADLGMTSGEARDLLRGAGVSLTDDAVADLLRRTEGWPVALYLAALALRSEALTLDELGFTGDDRLMSDYLRTELLASLDQPRREFLLRTSVLDRMSGPLCDAVTGQSGSAHVLAELESRNLLVVPLDRRRGWYRYHHLLHELLEAELRAEHPDEIVLLNSRAAAWHAANGMPETAIRHAQVAEDVELVTELVLEIMQPVWAAGRVDSVLAWMEWLGNRPLSEHYVAIAAHGALIFALLGRQPEAERWTDVAERQPRTGTLPDGSTVEGTLAYLRALLCRDGPAAMRDDAQAALRGLSPVSPYRATMDQVEGLSHLLDGDLGTADTLLAHAYDSAVGADSLPLATLVQAERAVVASRAGNPAAAEPLLRDAVDTVESRGFDRYWTSSLVLAAGARSAAERGDIPSARRLARKAANLRPLLTYALPVVSALALIELATAYFVLVDVAGAEAVLDQAAAILQQRPNLGRLADEVAGLRKNVAQFTGVTTGASSLTTAELRLVPLLATHLTLREMGERLFVSRHTVKSQVLSLYRKLGVSSRGEAVDRIHALGLHP
ncbi:LuxR C-terminal-related transcriptional regulator [Angustibacter sp. McL0619]|uniref:LuxR C-terminal-related transcriptional regulator n=1 Tax=Angustibacter sp. McL0619 TaxID=3415676 RepID=UPI003CED1DD4